MAQQRKVGYTATKGERNETSTIPSGASGLTLTVLASYRASPQSSELRPRPPLPRSHSIQVPQSPNPASGSPRRGTRVA